MWMSATAPHAASAAVPTENNEKRGLSFKAAPLLLKGVKVLDIGHAIAYTVAESVQLFLSFLLLAMFLRAILSWFFQPDSPLLSFFAIVTEPFILPFRYLLAKMNLLQDSPIDFSSLIAYLVIYLISIALPTITL